MKPTFEEIKKTCIEKRTRGCSYGEIYAFLDQYKVNSESRKRIIEELDKIDRVSEVSESKEKNKRLIKKGAIRILIGSIALFFGLGMAQTGYIFVLVWLGGIAYIIFGLIELLVGLFRKD